MSDSTQSTPAAAVAPFLFLEMVDQDNDPRKPGTVFTGERLKDNHPETYAAIVYMLGQGVGVREICRRLGVHHRTVQAVGIREGETIDTLRKELGARALGLAGLAMERLEEQIMSGGIKPGELAMTVGILVDKGQVLTGGVTGRVERVERHHVERELDALLEGVETIEGELVENTGSAGEGFLAIGDRSEDPAGCSATAPIDSESIAFDGAAIVGRDFATASATDGVAGGTGLDDAPDCDQGAGGVGSERGGSQNTTDTESGKF